MNANIREIVRKALKDKGLSQSELADELGVSRQTVNRAITGDKELGVWAGILDKLDLQLTVRPKTRGLEPLRKLIDNALASNSGGAADGFEAKIKLTDKQLAETIEVSITPPKLWRITLSGPKFPIEDIGELESFYGEPDSDSGVYQIKSGAFAEALLTDIAGKIYVIEPIPLD